MTLSFWIAQAFGGIAVALNIIAMQINNKKKVLLLCVLSNLFYTFNFIFLGALSGAIICFIAAIETYINYRFSKKNKELPYWIINSYILITIIFGLCIYTDIYDLIPISTAFLYIAAICIKRESAIRVFTLIEMALWIYYDFMVLAYLAGVSDLLIVASSAIGIFKYDLKFEKLKVLRSKLHERNFYISE